MLYMISYDLVAPGRDYRALDERITSLAGRRILESQWLLTHTASCSDIWQDLYRFIDPNDRLLVNEMTNMATWRTAGLLITDAEMQAFLSTARI